MGAIIDFCFGCQGTFTCHEVLIVFVSRRCAGQHRSPVSASLQEDRAEGEEEDRAGEQKEPRD